MYFYLSRVHGTIIIQRNQVHQALFTLGEFFNVTLSSDDEKHWWGSHIIFFLLAWQFKGISRLKLLNITPHFLLQFCQSYIFFSFSEVLFVDLNMWRCTKTINKTKNIVEDCSKNLEKPCNFFLKIWLHNFEWNRNCCIRKYIFFGLYFWYKDLCGTQTFFLWNLKKHDKA